MAKDQSLQKALSKFRQNCELEKRKCDAFAKANPESKTQIETWKAKIRNQGEVSENYAFLLQNARLVEHLILIYKDQHRKLSKQLQDTELARKTVHEALMMKVLFDESPAEMILAAQRLRKGGQYV